MKSNLFFVLIMLMVATSCRKHKTEPQQPPLTDAKSILLKDLELDHLPSPYFHFDYNESNFVTRIEFASHYSWQVQYENNRVIRMIRISNKDSLLYNYTNDQVTSIKHIDAQSGKHAWHYDFTYNNTGLLQQVRWWAFPGLGADSILYRKVILSYLPDSNLAAYYDYNLNNAGQIELTNTVTFSNYDDGINVDDFYLLKNSYDDFLFLPQVKMQKNNPRQLAWHSNNEDFTYVYTYTYNNNKVPTKRDYTLIISRGSSPGVYTGTDQYSYY